MNDILDDAPGLSFVGRPKKSSVTVDLSSSPVITETTKSSKQSINLENLAPEIKERLAMLSDLWKSDTKLNPKGEDLPITSGYRTREQQRQLYIDRLKNPNLVAEPGKSRHESGFAIDLHPRIPDSYLEQVGLYRPHGKKDPVHVEINPAFSFSPSMVADDDGYGITYAKPTTFKEFVPSSFAEDFRKTVGEMSVEDWKNKSLLGTATRYTAASLGLPGFTEEDKKPLEEKAIGFVQGVKAAVESPVETAKNVYKAVTERPGTVLGEMVKGAVYDPELLFLPGAKQTVQMAGQGVKKAGEGVVTGAQAVRNAVMPSEQQLVAQYNARRAAGTAPGGSVGAMATPDRATVDAMLASASPELQAKITSYPTELVDIKALENQLKGDKFGYQLTKGEALQDAAMMSDEFNKRSLPKNKELLDRLEDRDIKIAEGFNTLAAKAAPDLPGGMTLVDFGQTAIDQLIAKDKLRLDDIKLKYEALEKANGGQFPIDTNKLKADVDAELSKKVLKTYASNNMSSYLTDLADFQKRGNMTFDEFENLRTNLAEEMRTNPSGNARKVAFVIRDALEKLPMSEGLQTIKPLADAARNANKARHDVLNTNPAYRAAVKDTRLDSELVSGLEHVAADKFIKKFVIDGATADVKRMISELGENSLGHQAAQAGLIKHLENVAVGSKGVINQKSFNDALNKTIGKKLFDVMPNETAVDLKDLADLARLTEHVGGKGFANTSNTMPAMVREGALNAAEMGINVKTGSPLGSIGRMAMEKMTANKKIKESLELGAGVKKPIKDMLKDLEKEGK
jgi:D-alanyl-D-alanine dipeptidase